MHTLCPGNQTVKHGLKVLAAQLIVPACLLLLQSGVLQIGADAVLKDTKLCNGIRDAQPRCQRFLFQNGSEHGLIQLIEGSPAVRKLFLQMSGRIYHGVAEQPLVPGMLGEEGKPRIKILIRGDGPDIKRGR